MFLGRRSLGEGGYTAKLLARLVHIVEFETIIANES